jgi:hypothetical protein
MENIGKSNPSNNTPKLVIKNSETEFDIPVEGSLGLLALGAVGIKAWREKRKSVTENKENQNI